MSKAARDEGAASADAAAKDAAARRLDTTAIGDERRGLDTLAQAGKAASQWTEWGGRTSPEAHLADMAKELQYKDLINRAEWLNFTSPQAAYAWRQRELLLARDMNIAHFGGYQTPDQYLGFLSREYGSLRTLNEALLARAGLYKSNAEAALAYYNALQGTHKSIGQLGEGSLATGLSSAQSYEAALAGLPDQVTTHLSLDDSAFAARLAADRLMLADFARTYTAHDVITASYRLGGVPLDEPQPKPQVIPYRYQRLGATPEAPSGAGNIPVTFTGPWQEQAAAVLARIAELNRQRIEVPVHYSVDEAAAARAIAGLKAAAGLVRAPVPVTDGGAAGGGVPPPAADAASGPDPAVSLAADTLELDSTTRALIGATLALDAATLALTGASNQLAAATETLDVTTAPLIPATVNLVDATKDLTSATKALTAATKAEKKGSGAAAAAGPSAAEAVSSGDTGPPPSAAAAWRDLADAEIAELGAAHAARLEEMQAERAAAAHAATQAWKDLVTAEDEAWGAARSASLAQLQAGHDVAEAGLDAAEAAHAWEDLTGAEQAAASLAMADAARIDSFGRSALLASVDARALADGISKLGAAFFLLGEAERPSATYDALAALTREMRRAAAAPPLPPGPPGPPAPPSAAAGGPDPGDEKAWAALLAMINGTVHAEDQAAAAAHAGFGPPPQDQAEWAALTKQVKEYDAAAEQAAGMAALHSAYETPPAAAAGGPAAGGAPAGGVSDRAAAAAARLRELAAATRDDEAASRLMYAAQIAESIALSKAGDAAKASAVRLIENAAAAGDAASASKFAYAAQQEMAISARAAGAAVDGVTGKQVAAAAASKALTIALFAQRGGWFGLGGTLNIVGGVLGTVGVLHVVLDAIIEALAVLIPSIVTLAAGLTAFGLAGSDAAKAVYNRIVAIHTASDALGQTIPPMTGKLEALHAVVRPQVWQLYGDAIDVVHQKTGLFDQLAVQTGSTLDRLAGRFTAFVLGAANGLQNFFAVGAQDLAKIGQIFYNIGLALMSLIRVTQETHVDQIFLGIFVALSKLLELITRLPTPLLALAVGLHAAWLWGGLLATVILQLLNPLRALGLGLGGVDAALTAGGLASLGKDASPWERLKATIMDIGAGFAALPGRIAGSKTSLKEVSALSGESVASLASLRTTAERAGTSIADMVKGPAARDVAEFGKGVDAAGMDLLNLAAYANTSQAGLGKLAVGLGSTSEEAKVASAGMGSLAAGMSGASAKTGLFSGLLSTLGATMADPLTWILLAVAALAAFSVAVLRANDNTQLWIKSMDQQLTKASLFTVIGQTVSDLAAASQKLATAQAGGVGNAKELTAAQSDLSGKLSEELVHVGDVSKAYGVNMVGALSLLQTAGVKTSTLFTDQSKVWAGALEQVKGLVSGYAAMGQGLTQLQGDVSVQLVLGSDQLKSMQQLNQAWDNWITTVVGGETTFVKFQQTLATTNTAGKAAGASMGGLNDASLSLRSGYLQLLPEAGKVLDAIRTQSAVLQNGAAGSAILTRATRDLAAEMIPLAKGNKSAQDSLLALAQQADPSINTWQKLTKWVGPLGAAGAAASLDGILTQLETPVSNLAADAAKLTTTLQQELNPAMAQAEFAALGGQQAFNTFATDLQKLGPNAQPTITAAGQVANVLLAIDKNSGTAHDQFIAWAESMGVAAPQAEKLWVSASKLSSASYKLQIQDNITTEQNKISLLKQQISQTTDPAKKHMLQLELQVDEHKLAALEGDLKKAGPPASQLRTQLAGSATAAGDLSKSGLWGQIRDKIQQLFSFAQAHPITTTIFAEGNFIPGFTAAMDTAGHAITNFFTKTIPHAAGDFVNWFTQSLPHAWSTAYTGFQRDFAGPMTSWFTKSLPHAWDNVSSAFSTGWGTAYNGFQRDFAGPLTAWFTVSLPHAWGNVSSAVSTGWGTAYNGFQRDFAGPMTAWFTKSLPHAWNNVSSAVSTGWGTAYNGFQRDFAGPITYWATKLFPKSIVGQALSTAWGTAYNGFQRDFAGPMTAWFTQSLPHAVGVVGTAFSTAWGTAWNGFNRDVGGPLASWFTSSVPNFFDGVGRGWNRLWSTGWTNFVRDVWDPFSGFFTRTVQGWLDGVGRAWNSLWSRGWADFIRDVWTPFSNFFTKTVQGWFDSAGRAWNKLWSTGWADFVRDVWNPFSNFFTRTIPGWLGGTGTSWGKLWSKGWADFVRDVWNPFSNFFTRTVQGWFDGVGRGWNKLWSTGWTDFSRGILQPMERWFTTSLPTAIKNAFRDAVNWVIANIVNGAINIINAVTHPFGVPKITGVGPLGGGAGKAASGGVMPARMAAGSVPGTGDADGTHIIAMGGEYMLRKPARMALEAAYGRGFMNHLNQADSWLAAGSRGSPESQQRHPGRNYAAGGPVQPMAAGGTYQDPLRAVRLLTPERIDMGVDYNGFGPLYAVGPGTILRTAGPGWPGGVFIEERLSSGSEAGRYIYYAEDIHPSVGAGQNVNSNTVIGQLFGGPSGIEIGWGVPGSDSTLAAAFHQQSPTGDPGSRSTAYGASMNAFLVSLGAPSGRLQGSIAGNVAGGFMPPGGFGGLGAGIVGVVEGLLNSGGSALSSAVSAVSRFVKGGAAEAVKLAQQGARFLFDGAWDHTITPLVNQVPAGNWEGSAARLMPAAIKKGVDSFLGAKDAAAQVTAAASASSGPGMIGPVSGPADAGPAQAEAYAQSRLGAYGWGAGQFPPLQSLWNRESGWNRFARNPSSGAYGIPQALPPSKLPAAGQAGGGSHASPQIDWGLSYIKGRPGYGSPSAAWAHELAHNWYPFGGIIGQYADGGEAPAMASGGSVYRFPVPSRLHSYDVTDKGFRLAWDAVRGPAGQKPTGYGVETYQLNSKVVDKFTAHMTNTSEYGFGGKGLHPDWQYRTTVRPEGAPQASLGQASMMTRLHKAKAPGTPGKAPPPKAPPGPVNAPEWDATSVALHDAAYGEMSAFWNLMGMKLPKQATRAQHASLSAWDRALEAQQLKTVGLGRKPPGAYAVIEGKLANPKTITGGQWNTFFADLGREISEEAGPGIKGGVNPPGTPANSGWVPWHYFRGQWQALRTAMLEMQSKGQQARGVWSNVYGPGHLPATPGPPHPPPAAPAQPGGPGHLLDLRPLIIGGPATPVFGAAPDMGFASGGTIGLQQVAAMFAGAMPTTFMVPSAGPGGVSDALLRQLSGSQGKGPSESPRRLSQAGAAHRSAFNVEQMTINNPVSEQPSMSIARASNRMAFLAGRGES